MRTAGAAPLNTESGVDHKPADPTPGAVPNITNPATAAKDEATSIAAK